MLGHVIVQLIVVVFWLGLGDENVSPLEFKEEELVAIEQDFAEAAVPLDHVDQIYDVEIAGELSLALPEHQLEILVRRVLASLQAFRRPATKAPYSGGKELCHAVPELELVDQQVENGEELLLRWTKLANQSLLNLFYLPGE